MLSTDSRFQKRGVKFQKSSSELADIFCQESVISALNSSIKAVKHAAFFLNVLQYANSRNDSIATDKYSEDQILQILKSGFESVCEYESISDLDLQEDLGRNYIDYKQIETNEVESSKSKFLHQILNQNVFESTEPEFEVKQTSSEPDTDYWIQSVKLDFPYIPQPDGLTKVEEFQINSQHYCMYGESVLPWNQSQITSVTDVNAFSDSAILNLFPKIRLYTRSPYMYQKYEGLEYDEDLGVILKIKGFNKRQIKKNLIEYPHIVHIDRWVKQRGKDVTIPFWKHIEIDGEIIPTASVWSQLPDTKNLPQTESFMNEYVVRKYLLERDKGIEHKYPMRGDLKPFVTLYAPPSYYEEYKYDPIEIGRQCVISRVSFKRSRNPVLKMVHDSEQ